jgi:hypothetical protein
MITSLWHGNSIATGQEEIVNMVDEYYNNLLGIPTPRDHSNDLNALDLPRLDMTHVEAPFSKEEVHNVIKTMPLDKAQGPNGFTGIFYAVCWHIIKEDIMKAFELFYRDQQSDHHASS